VCDTTNYKKAGCGWSDILFNITKLCELCDGDRHKEGLTFPIQNFMFAVSNSTDIRSAVGTTSLEERHGRG